MEKMFAINEFIRSHRLIRAILLAAIVIFSISVSAQQQPEYLVAPQGVKVGDAWYPFGNERVDDAHKVFMNTISKHIECHATTRFAVRKKPDLIVLVETGRRKPSRSIGLLCFTSMDVSKFNPPFTF